MTHQDYLSDKEIAAHESAMQAIKDQTAAAEQGLRDAIERLNKELDKMHTQKEMKLESLIVAQERRIVLRRINNEAPDDIMELIVKKFSDVDEHGWGRGGMNALRLVSKRLMGVVESCATRLKWLGHDAGPVSFPLALRRCKRIQHIKCISNNFKSLEGCPDGLKSLELGCVPWSWNSSVVKRGRGASILSLEPLRGCKKLESLHVLNAIHISDLSPLSFCLGIKKLSLTYSRVTDISALLSMPLLEEVDLRNDAYDDGDDDDDDDDDDDLDRFSIMDLSPLIQSKSLQVLYIEGNRDIEDISPLAQCTQLEKIRMGGLPKITDLRPLSSLTKLKMLNIVGNHNIEGISPLAQCTSLQRLEICGLKKITDLKPLSSPILLKWLNIYEVPVMDLTPLSALQNLEALRCSGIPRSASLLPLARCSKLKKLDCDRNMEHMKELLGRPDVVLGNDTSVYSNF